MADEGTERVQVWLTIDADLIATGEIPAYMATIAGDYARIETAGCVAIVSPQGSGWHRTRWAAENYAIAIRNLRIQQLRDELARIEAYTFGRRP